MQIGYARVSTADQYLSMQEYALKGAGCEELHRRVAIAAEHHHLSINKFIAETLDHAVK